MPIFLPEDDDDLDQYSTVRRAIDHAAKALTLAWLLGMIVLVLYVLGG